MREPLLERRFTCLRLLRNFGANSEMAVGRRRCANPENDLHPHQSQMGSISYRRGAAWVEVAHLRSEVPICRLIQPRVSVIFRASHLSWLRGAAPCTILAGFWVW